jgi:hypothetical protein
VGLQRWKAAVAAESWLACSDGWQSTPEVVECPVVAAWAECKFRQ